MRGKCTKIFINPGYDQRFAACNFAVLPVPLKLQSKALNLRGTIYVLNGKCSGLLNLICVYF